MKEVPGARVGAVVSRSPDRAKSAAKSFGAQRWSTSLDELLNEGGIDAVYVATPHTNHFDTVMTALEHRVPVLCEKPLTVNYHLARQLVDAARKAETLLMEALWSKFHPLIRQLWDFLDHGYLGDVRSMRLEFGFRPEFNPEGRLFNPRLGGGATLDVGIYPLWLPLAFWGEPTSIEVVGQAASTGVDVASQTILSFSGGGMASVESSLVYAMENGAQVFGSKGRIKIDPPWFAPKRIAMYPTEGKEEIWTHRGRGTGLNFEVEHFQSLIDKGAKESPIHSLEDSLLLSKVMDRIMSKI